MENTEIKEQTYISDAPEQMPSEAAVTESPGDLITETPTARKPKGKRGIVIAIVAIVLVVAAAVGFLLLPKGTNVNKLLANKTYEFYGTLEDNGSWIYMSLTFDTSGEKYTYEFYSYENTDTEATLDHNKKEIACTFEKVDNGVYKMGDFKITVNDEGIERFVLEVDGEIEFTETEASTVSEYLEDQAIEIFSNQRVYSYAAYDFAQVIPTVVKDYQLSCEAVSLTQYRITVTGDYYPNKKDLPSYVESGGKLTYLVDIEEKSAECEESVGIRSAMEVYVALSMW